MTATFGEPYFSIEYFFFYFFLPMLPILCSLLWHTYMYSAQNSAGRFSRTLKLISAPKPCRCIMPPHTDGTQTTYFVLAYQYIYYCMTGRSILGNIPFEIDRIELERREGRYLGREQNISPYCPIQGISIIDLVYNFRITIGTGNNEHRYRHGQ